MSQVAKLKAPPKVERAEVKPIPGMPASARVVGGSLNPVVDFTARDAQLGDYVTGKFLRKRTMILNPKEPQKITTVYDLEPTCTFDGGEKPREVSIWGASILDLRMADVKPGQMVGVQYTGQVPTKRGQNPAKDFTVTIWDEPVRSA